MSHSYKFLICTVAILAAAPGAWAQTSLPASRATTRRVLDMPPGYARVTNGSRNALCEPGDEAWAKKALATVQPTTRPTTMPSDLVARLAEKRESITRQIVADLGVEESSVAPLFDEKLLPSLRQLDQIDPPVFYLVTTRPKLIALLRGGWEDPRFYYNRVANDVSFQMNLTMSLDHELDDTVLPVLYEEKDDAAMKEAALVKTVRQTEESVVSSIAARSMFIAQMGFIEFIGKNVIVPLKLHDDQQWFGLGLVGAVGATYGAQALGMTRAEILRQMTFEHPRVPVKVASIDLLHPTPLTDLKREYVPFYVDAMRRKSTAVISAWIDRAGNDAVPKTLAAIRKQTPANGAGLVKLIKDTTGEDLTKELSAR